MNDADLITWLHEQLAKAEQSLRSREQMAESCERSADPNWWKEMASQPGVIVTKTHRGAKAPTAKELLKQAVSHRRIGAKDRLDVEMFETLLARLTPPSSLPSPSS